MRAPSSLRSFSRGLAALALLAAAVVADGCSLGNVARDDCTGDDQCAALFGLGSSCSDGYCTAPMTCTTGHDCRRELGGGACVAGVCQAEIPADDACTTIVEPEDLLTSRLVGADAPILIGSIFSHDGSNDKALITAVRLAVREINRKGGMVEGRRLGVVVCDNGGPGNTAVGDDRIPLNNHALDYLGGTLGVPVIVGPLASSDSIRLVNRLKEKRYPTVIISPSATSPDLTKIDDRLDTADAHGLFWRTCPSDELQGKVLATSVIGADETIKKVAVIYIRDAYGEGLATVFRTTYGLEAALPFPYDPADLGDAAKLTEIAEKAAAENPDAVLLVSLRGSDAVEVLKAMAGTALAQKKLFFTDGAKDASSILAANLPMDVKTMVANARGTAPASPSGSNYDLFMTNLEADFDVDASAVSFLAHAYDATYVGAYGILHASTSGSDYDGRDVAEGLAQLSSGPKVNIAPTEWLTGKSELTMGGTIDVEGASGHLDFDPATGEAPGTIEVWGVAPDMMGFVTIDTIDVAEKN